MYAMGNARNADTSRVWLHFDLSFSNGLKPSPKRGSWNKNPTCSICVSFFPWLPCKFWVESFKLAAFFKLITVKVWLGLCRLVHVRRRFDSWGINHFCFGKFVWRLHFSYHELAKLGQFYFYQPVMLVGLLCWKGESIFLDHKISMWHAQLCMFVKSVVFNCLPIGGWL